MKGSKDPWRKALLRTLITSLALALLLAAPAAGAQTLYKSIMPDGRVVYGEKPAPGAQRTETIEPPPPRSGIRMVSPEESKGIHERMKKRYAAEAAAQRELEQAQDHLRQAEAARGAGKEPLPAERVGPGGALSEAYAQRQKRLEQAVEFARKRLEKAEQAAR
jgi:hypothetical protein